MSEVFVVEWSLVCNDLVVASGVVKVRDYDTVPLHNALIDAGESRFVSDSFSCYLVVRYTNVRNVSRVLTVYVSGTNDLYNEYTASLVGCAVSMVRRAREPGL